MTDMMDDKEWKITVAYDHDGYPPVEQGARYTLLAPECRTPDEVAYLALRDAVARQFKLDPGKRNDFITVGVWDTSGEYPENVALWTGRWKEVEDPFGNCMIGAYIHPSGPTIEPQYLGSARTLIDYDEWEKA